MKKIDILVQRFRSQILAMRFRFLTRLFCVPSGATSSNNRVSDGPCLSDCGRPPCFPQSRVSKLPITITITIDLPRGDSVRVRTGTPSSSRVAAPAPRDWERVRGRFDNVVDQSERWASTYLKRRPSIQIRHPREWERHDEAPRNVVARPFDPAPPA